MLQKELNAISPRKLIMSLFNAPETSTLTIKQIISAGSLFEFEPATMRMAVTRLIKDELISATARSIYKAGDKSINLNSQTQSWRTADKRITQWQQQWYMALSAHLGRTNKSRLRLMSRAFMLNGFAEIETGVWVRPANLRLETDTLRHNLISLGMDSRTYLMRVSEVDQQQHNSWCLNWPTNALESRYREMIKTLAKSTARLENLNNRDAAAESLVIGESAIRLINLDPLLPNEIIDASLFRGLVEAMNDYDKLGQRHWQEFLS